MGRKKNYANMVNLILIASIFFLTGNLGNNVVMIKVENTLLQTNQQDLPIITFKQTITYNINHQIFSHTKLVVVMKTIKNFVKSITI